MVAGMLLLFTKQLIQVFIFKVKPIGIRDFFFHHFFLTQVLNIFQWTRHHFMTLHVITVHRNCFCASSIWMRHKRLQYVVFYKRGFCKDCHLKLCLKKQKYMYYYFHKIKKFIMRERMIKLQHNYSCFPKNNCFNR